MRREHGQRRYDDDDEEERRPLRRRTCIDRSLEYRHGMKAKKLPSFGKGAEALVGFTVQQPNTTDLTGSDPPRWLHSL
jgi:hypothetical protein